MNVQYAKVVNQVEISGKAQKQMVKIPGHIAKKLLTWVSGIKKYGLENIRKIPSYHDEPLKGALKGQRSIRLNKDYRAIYVVKLSGTVEFVNIEEVSKHDY